MSYAIVAAPVIYGAYLFEFDQVAYTDEGTFGQYSVLWQMDANSDPLSHGEAANLYSAGNLIGQVKFIGMSADGGAVFQQGSKYIVLGGGLIYDTVGFSSSVYMNIFE